MSAIWRISPFDWMYQRQGIGVDLITLTRERMGPRSMLVLLAAPKADRILSEDRFYAARKRLDSGEGDRFPSGDSWFDISARLSVRDLRYNRDIALLRGNRSRCSRQRLSTGIIGSHTLRDGDNVSKHNPRFIYLGILLALTSKPGLGTSGLPLMTGVAGPAISLTYAFVAQDAGLWKKHGLDARVIVFEVRLDLRPSGALRRC